MSIGEFCNREVVIADPETTALEAAQLMRQFHVGSLVVVDSMDGPRRPVGIVTDRDIAIEVVAKQVAPGSVRLGEMLVGTLATVAINEGVFDTLRYMRENGIRRMPVVDANGQLAGIVTMDDFLGLLSDELTELARLMAREQKHETTLRK